MDSTIVSGGPGFVQGMAECLTFSERGTIPNRGTTDLHIGGRRMAGKSVYLCPRNGGAHLDYQVLQGIVHYIRSDLKPSEGTNSFSVTVVGEAGSVASGIVVAVADGVTAGVAVGLAGAGVSSPPQAVTNNAATMTKSNNAFIKYHFSSRLVHVTYVPRALVDWEGRAWSDH